MGFLSNQFSIVPQYLHDLISPRQALQAPLSLGNAESLLNAVLLLDKDNNLRSASVVVLQIPGLGFFARPKPPISLLGINLTAPNHNRCSTECTPRSIGILVMLHLPHKGCTPNREKIEKYQITFFLCLFNHDLVLFLPNLDIITLF